MKIISGGQTGVDLAALDAAIQSGIEHGGYCPKGRFNQAGIIPPHYQLQEVEGEFTCEQENYDCRTKRNITVSAGTLILVPQLPLPPTIKDGTLLTIAEVNRQHKPHLLIDLSVDIQDNIHIITEWIRDNHIECLNVAGPRESTWNGIYESSLKLLHELLPILMNHHALISTFKS